MFNEYSQGIGTLCTSCHSSGAYGAYLPASNAEQEADDIRLLLLLQLLEILVSTHLGQISAGCHGDHISQECATAIADHASHCDPWSYLELLVACCGVSVWNLFDNLSVISFKITLTDSRGALPRLRRIT
jgi:hypothetical protein